MQLASGFMQLTAAGCRCNIVHFRCHFKRKMLITALEWGLPYSKFSSREVYRRIYIQKSSFTAPLTRRRKTQFPTVYPTIYLHKRKFWIQLSPKCYLFLKFHPKIQVYSSLISKDQKHRVFLRNRFSTRVHTGKFQ